MVCPNGQRSGENVTDPERDPFFESAISSLPVVRRNISEFAVCAGWKCQRGSRRDADRLGGLATGRRFGAARRDTDGSRRFEIRPGT